VTKLLSYLLGAGVLLSGCGVSQTEVEATVVPAIATPLDDSTTITNVPAPEETAWGERRIKRVADKTRQAVVEIHNNVRGVRGTGTYFKFKDYHIVLTAAHVVDGGANIMEVRAPSGESTSGLILLFDMTGPSDMAVLVLKEELMTRKAMELKIRQGISQAIAEDVVYTGDPGHHRQMTIFGNISGLTENGSIVMHSYAWGGASGSSVFDDKGRLVGILKAVDVNRSTVSPFPQITEDMVWLSPGWLIDLEYVEKLLQVYELMIELQGGVGK
jgi:S1-C subfamily serine protease